MIEKPSLSDLVSSFQLSKSVVDVSNIDQKDRSQELIYLDVEFIDGYYGYFEWRSSSGSGNPITISSSGGNDGQSYALNKYSMNGVWALDYALITPYDAGSDETGRQIEYHSDDFDALDFHTEFNVIGGLSDNTPPEILSLNYSDDVFDVSDLESGQSIEFSFTASIRDEMSGVSSIWSEWRSPSGNDKVQSEWNHFNEGRLVSGDANYGIFEGSTRLADLKRTDEPGIWTLEVFSVTDKMDNNNKNDMYDFMELGLPYSFEVVNSRIPTKEDESDQQDYSSHQQDHSSHQQDHSSHQQDHSSNQQDYSSDQQVVNNVTNVVNEITNNTTVNIENSGSGNVTVGDIGSVNNTTTVDNSFTISITNINLSLAITGDSKKSEKVEGTEGDDLIADGRGKDKLFGGDGADQFYFAGEEPFKKKAVDKVIDFDSSEGDAIIIADDVVGDLTEDLTLAIADTKKDLKQLTKDGYDLLYFEPKGDLYVDGNGDSKGFGKKSEGGIITDLPKDTILTENDVLIGV